MSNTPGINPLTPDLEEVRHSDDPAFTDPSAPDDRPESDPQPVETEEDAAARIQRQTLDLA